MDKRLSLIPRFPNLKNFKHGLQNIKKFTASEYQDIMKVAVFTINGILNSVNKKNLLFEKKVMQKRFREKVLK